MSNILEVIWNTFKIVSLSLGVFLLGMLLLATIISAFNTLKKWRKRKSNDSDEKETMDKENMNKKNIDIPNAGYQKNIKEMVKELYPRDWEELILSFEANNPNGTLMNNYSDEELKEIKNFIINRRDKLKYENRIHIIVPDKNPVRDGIINVEKDHVVLSFPTTSENITEMNYTVLEVPMAIFIVIKNMVKNYPELVKTNLVILHQNCGLSTFHKNIK